MVVAGTAVVGMGGKQLALSCRPRQPPVEPVLDDRLDRSMGTGADIEAAAASRFRPVGAVLAAQAENTDAGAVALLGVTTAPQELTTATASISIMKSGPARRVTPTVVLVGVATPR